MSPDPENRLQRRDANVETSQFILQMASSWIIGGYDELFQTQAVQLTFNTLTDPSAAVVLSLTSANILNIVSSGFLASYDLTP